MCFNVRAGQSIYKNKRDVGVVFSEYGLWNFRENMPNSTEIPQTIYSNVLCMHSNIFTYIHKYRRTFYNAVSLHSRV